MFEVVELVLTDMCLPLLFISSTCALIVEELEWAQALVQFFYVFTHTKCMSRMLFNWVLNWPFKTIQLSATDLLALASMKNAAKCDK